MRDNIKKQNSFKHFAGFLFSFALLFILACGKNSAAATPEELAFQHLNTVVDKFHKTFDVYSDLSAAGNHFVTLGKMSSSGDEDKVEINPGYTSDRYAGSTCIENRLYTNSNGNNWGGFYFLNGVLEGEETQPKANWGDYPDAGVNLSGAKRFSFWAKGKNGGELVEFFAFGVGTGTVTKPYPDSSKKISLGNQKLTKSWKKYTSRDLSKQNLSYVLGGFGWAASAGKNNKKDIAFYLDDIKYDKSRLSDKRLLVSYETISSSLDFDTIMRNVAFTYDNALALIAYLARGTTDDMKRAKYLADAFVYAVNNDRYFSDGRLRNAYQGGDLALPPGWQPHGKKDTVRMPGWYNTSTYEWNEDKYQVSAHTGNLAWVMIALLSYYKEAGGSDYLEAAQTLGEWIYSETYDTNGYGGYTGGYEGWEETGSNPDGQTKVTWKATEHNIDVYVAFMRLYEATHDSTWKDRALHASDFVEAMWDDDEGHFWTGTDDDGALNKGEFKRPEDVNTWGLMALGDMDKYKAGITWVENKCYVEADGFKGFDFNNDTDHVWFEGTAHMALVYKILGDTTNAKTYLAELEKAQKSATNNNGKGIVAASYDGLTTGFTLTTTGTDNEDWLYYNRLHVGATAWFIFAERGYNPYWNIATTDSIPAY